MNPAFWTVRARLRRIRAASACRERPLIFQAPDAFLLGIRISTLTWEPIQAQKAF